MSDSQHQRVQHGDSADEDEWLPGVVFMLGLILGTASMVLALPFHYAPDNIVTDTMVTVLTHLGAFLIFTGFAVAVLGLVYEGISTARGWYHA